MTSSEESTGSGEGDKKKRQRRGGKAQIKTKQKQEVEKKICLSRSVVFSLVWLLDTLPPALFVSVSLFCVLFL